MNTTSLTCFGIYVLLVIVISEISRSCAEPTSTRFEFDAENTGADIDEQGLDNPKMLWSTATNVITGETHVSGTIGELKPITSLFRSGISANGGLILVSLEQKKTLNVVYRAIENMSTNQIDAFLPDYDERFVVTLTDTNGITVPKTLEGLAVGKPITINPHTRPSQAKHNLPLWPKHIFMQELDPTKYFKIEQPGLYKLTLVQRLYVVDTNIFLKTIFLPPVNVDVRVEK